MKRLLIAVLLLFLVACEPITTDQPNEINCDIYPTHKDCADNTDNDPVISNDDPYPNSGGYENLGFGSDDVYTGRDLVTDDCDYLDNIGAWQPVWCDEFEYTGLPDSSLWNYDVGDNGWGNQELQNYTNADEDNAYVNNGVLRIITKQESVNNITSARLVSRDKGDWLYGKIQVRAKIPAGLGTWPAIWMLSTDWEYGGWPASGEIDIMEYVGYDPNVMHGSIHTDKYNHKLGTQFGRSRTIATIEEEFHVYEIEWEVGVVRFYVDGNLYSTFEYDPAENTDVDPYQAFPFDKRFHLLLNTAFGGSWGGALGVDLEILPVEFVIDYVRVYQKDYAGMDQEAPSTVFNLHSARTQPDSLFLTWDQANDDVMVKEYHVYVDDVLNESITVNGHLLKGLTPNTTYEIKVVAEDFAGNLSDPVVAMIQTSSPPTTNDRIEAEDYLSAVGVGVEDTQDAGGGLNVGWIDTNDSMTYLIEVTEAGQYQILYRIASQTNGAHLDFYLDDVLLGTMDSDATGDWQTWTDAYSSIFNLTPGTYDFTIKATQDGFNLNYFEFVKVN